MQGTAECHHEIADTLLPQTDPIFDDATARHTTVDMFDAQSTLVQRLIRRLLRERPFLTAWLLRWREDLDLRKRERQKAHLEVPGATAVMSCWA